MIMAIGAVVIIAGVMALSLSLSTQSQKRTTDIYLYEQALIYTKSATEFALLKIAEVTPCSITSLNQAFPPFDLNITMRYVYTLPSPCVNTDANLTVVSTPEQNGSVLIDATVTTDAGTETIRVFKRTIQKL